MHPGNHFQIQGGFKGQRNRVIDVMTFCTDELLPLHRTLDIDVQLSPLERNCNAMGQCLHVQGNEFQIEIDSMQKLYDLILTVCHEMVHVNQYARKHLVEDFPKSYWHGECHSDARCYPWEIEAWKLQKPLAHSYIKQAFTTPIKVLKTLDKRS